MHARPHLHLERINHQPSRSTFIQRAQLYISFGSPIPSKRTVAHEQWRNACYSIHAPFLLIRHSIQILWWQLLTNWFNWNFRKHAQRKSISLPMLRSFDFAASLSAVTSARKKYAIDDVCQYTFDHHPYALDIYMCRQMCEGMTILAKELLI